MKPSSGTLWFLRVFVCVVALVFAVGYYGHVRAQSGTGKPVIPLRPLAPLSSVPVPPVFGMEGILADKATAVQLGKALFWDMQAGSDDIQACASCHFNAGADSRANNQVNPGQAGGDNSFQMGMSFAGLLGPNYHCNPGTPEAGFGGYHDGDFPFHKVADPKDRYSVVSDVNDVSGSEGVFATSMISIDLLRTGNGNGQGGTGSTDDGGNDAEGSDDAGLNFGKDAGGAGVGVSPHRGGHNGGSSSSGVGITATLGPITSVESNASTMDAVFSYPDPADSSKRINVRKTTGRNTPSVVNAVFNFRNFWDGRAQNVCNGANPFGARDKDSHLLIGDAVDGKLGPALVHMQNSALCSQALGPILSSVEMSADGRNLRQVGKKLLNRQPLARQMVDPTDSVLGVFSSSPATGLNTRYSDLIQKAFLPEWWNSKHHVCQNPDGSRAGEIDPTVGQFCPNGTQDFSQMEYNFSLFWGVAIQMYESTLVSDQTPFDKYLEQQQTYMLVGDNQKNSYTIQLKPGLDPYTISVVALNPNLDFSDQDVYSFDNGFGQFIGTGVDGTIDYAAGSITVNFEDPPVSTVPV